LNHTRSDEENSEEEEEQYSFQFDDDGNETGGDHREEEDQYRFQFNNDEEKKGIGRPEGKVNLKDSLKILSRRSVLTVGEVIESVLSWSTRHKISKIAKEELFQLIGKQWQLNVPSFYKALKSVAAENLKYLRFAICDKPSSICKPVPIVLPPNVQLMKRCPGCNKELFRAKDNEMSDHPLQVKYLQLVCCLYIFTLSVLFSNLSIACMMSIFVFRCFFIFLSDN
jgi:hypothetical protein